MPKSQPAQLYGHRCMVPLCNRREACSYRFSRRCMLRRIFLTEYVENKRRYSIVKHLLDGIHLKIFHRKVYFWKMDHKQQHGGNWKIPLNFRALQHMGAL